MEHQLARATLAWLLAVLLTTAAAAVEVSEPAWPADTIGIGA